MKRVRMYINGEFVESSGNTWFPVYDPSTEETIGEVPEGNATDVDRAAKAARAAFETGAWPQTTRTGSREAALQARGPHPTPIGEIGANLSRCNCREAHRRSRI